jgi:hypothetical protein
VKVENGDRSTRSGSWSPARRLATPSVSDTPNAGRPCQQRNSPSHGMSRRAGHTLRSGL